MLFNGVRSSCDMLARNSDLYFDVSASSLGLFLQRPPRLLDLLVLAFDLDVALGQLLRLLLELFVRLLQLLLLGLQFGGELLRLLEQPLPVCIVASMLLTTMPMLAVSCSRNPRWAGPKVVQRGERESPP